MTIIHYLVGIIVGGGLGAGSWALVSSTQPNMVFGNIIPEMDKCKISNTKLNCAMKAIEVSKNGDDIKNAGEVDTSEWTSINFMVAMNNGLKFKRGGDMVKHV